MGATGREGSVLSLSRLRRGLGREVRAGPRLSSKSPAGSCELNRLQRPAALPGFKGPLWVKLPFRPSFAAPLSPAWLWHREHPFPFPALANPTCPLAVRLSRRAPGAPRGSSPSRRAPTFGLSAGAGERTLPLQAFYFKYLMIGPGRAESIFSVYHVWRANHGVWRLGSWGPRSRGRHRVAREPSSLPESQPTK